MRDYRMVLCAVLFGCTADVNGGGCRDGCGGSMSATDAAVDDLAVEDLAVDDLATAVDLVSPPDLTPDPDYFPKSYGSDVAQEVALAVFAVPEGGYIVAGWSRSFSGARPAVWILRLDWRGAIEWQKVYAETNREQEGLAARPIVNAGVLEGFYVAGVTRMQVDGVNDALLIRLTPTGDVVWARSYGTVGAVDTVESLRVLPGGDCLLAGSSRSYGDGTNTAAWIFKVRASDGLLLWQHALGRTTEVGASDVEVLAGGDLALVGQIGGPADLLALRVKVNETVEPATLSFVWQHRYHPQNPAGAATARAHAIAEVPYGVGQYDLAIGGETSTSGTTVTNDALVLRVDESDGLLTGAHAWARRYRRWDFSAARALAATPDGNVIVGGISRGTGMLIGRFFAWKLDFATGDVPWARIFASHSSMIDGEIFAVGLAPTDTLLDAGYIFAGNTVDDIRPSGSYWVVRTDDEGAIPGTCPDYVSVDGMPGLIDAVATTVSDSGLADLAPALLNVETRAITASDTTTDYLAQCTLP